MTYFLEKLTITNFQNLTHINLSNNKITNLPKNFGTLPCIQWLDLSYNRLGIRGQYKWLWIEQFAIQKSLIFLNISYNLVSHFIIKRYH